jgi:hypothetical protein
MYKHLKPKVSGQAHSGNKPFKDMSSTPAFLFHRWESPNRVHGDDLQSGPSPNRHPLQPQMLGSLPQVTSHHRSAFARGNHTGDVQQQPVTCDPALRRTSPGLLKTWQQGPLSQILRSVIPAKGNKATGCPDRGRAPLTSCSLELRVLIYWSCFGILVKGRLPETCLEEN